MIQAAHRCTKAYFGLPLVFISSMYVMNNLLTTGEWKVICENMRQRCFHSQKLVDASVVFTQNILHNDSYEVES